jgi:tRNA G18 (ribose-2'-O)-methylase SpoU
MRAAGTALLTTAFERGPSIQDLRITGAPLLALDAGGKPLQATIFPQSFALLPGVEGPGIPDHVEGSQRISIPMEPGVESLNAATATAIALYEWRRTQ